MLFLAKNTLFQRLYRISFKSSLVICLPLLILIGWMIADAYLEYRRFADIACHGKAPSFNGDIMHLFLRNSLLTAFVRSTASEMPKDEILPTIQLSIYSKSLGALNANLPKSGKENYYRAYVKYGGNRIRSKRGIWGTTTGTGFGIRNPGESKQKKTS